MPNNIVDNIEQCCPDNIVASCFQQLLIFGRVSLSKSDLVQLEICKLVDESPENQLGNNLQQTCYQLSSS